MWAKKFVKTGGIWRHQFFWFATWKFQLGVILTISTDKFMPNCPSQQKCKCRSVYVHTSVRMHLFASIHNHSYIHKYIYMYMYVYLDPLFREILPMLSICHVYKKCWCAKNVYLLKHKKYLANKFFNILQKKQVSEFGSWQYIS